MDCDKCGICQQEIPNDEKLYVTLTEKGALGVCNASRERGDNLIIKTADKVHIGLAEVHISIKKTSFPTTKRSCLLMEKVMLVKGC